MDLGHKNVSFIPFYAQYEFTSKKMGIASLRKKQKKTVNSKKTMIQTEGQMDDRTDPNS